jgi:hypothetical protein
VDPDELLCASRVQMSVMTKGGYEIEPGHRIIAVKHGLANGTCGCARDKQGPAGGGHHWGHNWHQLTAEIAVLTDVMPREERIGTATAVMNPPAVPPIQSIHATVSETDSPNKGFGPTARPYLRSGVP